jgi:streptogramin lyase
VIEPQRTRVKPPREEAILARNLIFVVAMFVAATIVAACGNSSGLLAKHQLRTPLECPCPALQPLAVYSLPSANSYLGSMISGPDGNVWLTESDANKIARVTLNGTITEFPIPTAGTFPIQIAAGPDGNLWFTEGNFNTIGRITTAGVVTEFPLPPPLSTAPVGSIGLWGLAAGPDGNIWFVHYGANVIGVMSKTGSLLATYAIPTANSGAIFIVKGPDGNMWFTEGGATMNCVNNIAKITMSGIITELPIPTPACDNPFSNIGGLVVGADGNIWFTERYSARIGRVTTGGLFDEFPVPANPAADRLQRITATADGSLWFVQAEISPPWNSEVGEMDLSGVVTNLWSFPNGFPRAVGTGSDGSPFITDESKDTLVRI